MTDLLEQISDELTVYPSTYLTIEIIDVDWPGVEINDEEEVEFRFQVSNSGPLIVRNPSFKVEGLNGTLVRGNGAAAAYLSSFDTTAGFFPDVPAHQPNNPVTWTSGPFRFKPTRSSSISRELVRVSMGEWDSDWDHPMVSHTRPDANANASYSSAVDVA